MKITGNEPAMPITSTHGFPTHLKNLNIDGTGVIGLTIRQQFAMAAMQGLLASPRQYTGLDWIVQNSVELADTLIAELNRKEE